MVNHYQVFIRVNQLLYLFGYKKYASNSFQKQKGEIVHFRVILESVNR